MTKKQKEAERLTKMLNAAAIADAEDRLYRAKSILKDVGKKLTWKIS